MPPGMRRRLLIGLLAAVLGGTLLPLASPSPASAEDATYAPDHGSTASQGVRTAAPVDIAADPG